MWLKCVHSLAVKQQQLINKCNASKPVGVSVASKTTGINKQKINKNILATSKIDFYIVGTTFVLKLTFVTFKKGCSIKNECV